jgi:hypothetical protein
MVVGAIAARHMGARLRLATRHEALDPAALGQVLRANQIKWDGVTDFAHIPLGKDRPLAPRDRVSLAGGLARRTIRY